MPRPRLNALLIVSVLLWIFVLSSINVVHAQDGFYSYNASKKTWIWNSYVWSPSYSKVEATISIVGLPSEHPITILVDGQPAVRVNSSDTVNFVVDGTQIHTFQVDDYIPVNARVKYYCFPNSWSTLQTQQQNYYGYNPYPYYSYYPYAGGYPQTSTTNAQSHSFVYSPVYLLTVQSKYGEETEADFYQGYSQERTITHETYRAGFSKWYEAGSVVTLSTQQKAQISDVERDVFVGWSVDGNINSNQSSVVVTIDAPHNVTAVYETQYLLNVESERGDPKGSGWYAANSGAKISIQESFPMEGVLGALGGTYEFSGWTGADTNNPTSIVTMNGPKIVTARWMTNFTIPLAIIGILVIAVIIGGFLAYTISRRFSGSLKKRPTEALPEPRRLLTYRKSAAEEEPVDIDPMEILKMRYANGEINHEQYREMKKELAT